jgi:hypothetical protein
MRQLIHFQQHGFIPLVHSAPKTGSNVKTFFHYVILYIFAICFIRIIVQVRTYSNLLTADFESISTMKTFQQILGYFNISLPIRNYCAHIVVTKHMLSMQFQPTSNLRNHRLCKGYELLLSLVDSAVIVLVTVIIITAYAGLYLIDCSCIIFFYLDEICLSLLGDSGFSSRDSSVSIVTTIRA